MKKKITGLALGGMLLALSFPAEAQQPKKVPRLGVLSSGSSGSDPRLNAFRQGLHDLGYVEGQSIAVEYRFAEGNLDRLPGLAAKLVRARVDLIVTWGPGIGAAQQATSTIPIVIASAVDTGYAASLARPGGNITGLTLISTDLMGKRLELLKEAFPKISRLALLTVSPAASGIARLAKETEVAAQSLGLKLQILEVQGAEDIKGVFAAMAKERPGALYVVESPVLLIHRTLILDLAIKRRLPTFSGAKAFVDAGGLMSYGADSRAMFRRAATYVDKILKGAKPADLPVQQPMKFELVINLRTAKQIGVTIPPEMLMWADQVIK